MDFLDGGPTPPRNRRSVVSIEPVYEDTPDPPTFTVAVDSRPEVTIQRVSTPPSVRPRISSPPERRASECLLKSPSSTPVPVPRRKSSKDHRPCNYDLAKPI